MKSHEGIIFQKKNMNNTENEYQQKINVLKQHAQEDKKDNLLEPIVSFLVDKLNMNEDLVMRLPIYKMDEIKVDVFIKSYQYQKTKIILFIEDVVPELFCVHDDCVGYHEYMRKYFELKSVNHGEVSKVLEEIRKTLNNLEFSKLHGTFSEKGKHDNTLLIWKSLLVADNIQWSVNECVVCMEDTISKTICGHHLCRCCFQRLKQSKCPVCRQSLSLDNDTDESDEE